MGGRGGDERFRPVIEVLGKATPFGDKATDGEWNVERQRYLEQIFESLFTS